MADASGRLDYALSLWQPWTTLVVIGEKPVENRTWPAPDWIIDQRIGIHAAVRHDGNAFRSALIIASSLDDEGNMQAWLHGWWANRDLPYGALAGSVQVAGCHHARECEGECSLWAERGDVYHWTFIKPEELRQPIPMRGRQRLWRLPDDLPYDLAVPA